jgi:hypothetical protein
MMVVLFYTMLSLANHACLVDINDRMPRSEAEQIFNLIQPIGPCALLKRYVFIITISYIST